jgi:arsenate reductase
MKKPKVLFICVHNSARSQMAAALLNKICTDHFEAHSAGLEIGPINPYAIQVMSEIGIDISHNTTQTVFKAWRMGMMFTHVITVCSEAESKARACPIFPGPVVRLSWPFDDPAAFRGSHGARLEQMRSIRDAIDGKVREWCDSVCSPQAPEEVANSGS